MDKIKILVEGYAHSGKGGIYIASCTTILIEHKGKKILVDPGANPDKLSRALAKEKLAPGDINIVFLSHYHPDHFLNIRLFPKHSIYDGTMIWKSDEELQFSGKLPGTDLEIIPTPGHAPEQASIVVHTKQYGVVCVAQDVFWWEDGKQQSQTKEQLMALVDPFAIDGDALRLSREKVLSLADWIIPGHGEMFQNPLRRMKL